MFPSLLSPTPISVGRGLRRDPRPLALPRSRTCLLVCGLALIGKTSRCTLRSVPSSPLPLTLPPPGESGWKGRGVGAPLPPPTPRWTSYLDLRNARRGRSVDVSALERDEIAPKKGGGLAAPTPILALALRVCRVESDLAVETPVSDVPANVARATLPSTPLAVRGRGSAPSGPGHQWTKGDGVVATSASMMDLGEAHHLALVTVRVASRARGM